MTLNWKLLAASAGGAFFLSFFTGIIGKVDPGTAFLRALIWGVVFGGLAFGIDYALRNYLPGLFSREGQTPPREAPTVDITIEDENPHDSGTRDELQGGAAVGSDGELSESDETDGFGDIEDGPGVVDGTADVSAGTDEEGQEMTPARRKDISEGELPGFDSLEATFASTEPDDSADESAAVGVDLFGSEEDPEIVARAVRTFMNKDKEG